MKNNKIFKALTFIAVAVMLLAMFALPVCAEETTSSPQIQINPNFDANQTIRTVFNWLIGVLAIAGAGVGGYHIVMGQINQDPKERSGGILTVIISLAVGGLMLTIINMVLM